MAAAARLGFSHTQTPARRALNNKQIWVEKGASFQVENLRCTRRMLKFSQETLSLWRDFFRVDLSAYFSCEIKLLSLVNW